MISITNAVSDDTWATAIILYVYELNFDKCNIPCICSQFSGCKPALRFFSNQKIFLINSCCIKSRLKIATPSQSLAKLSCWGWGIHLKTFCILLYV